MIKKLLTTAIILRFIGINVNPSTGTTLKQRSSLPTISGNTLYVGGIGPDNYTSIQAAINDASDGDTIFVYEGINILNLPPPNNIFKFKCLWEHY